MYTQAVAAPVYTWEAASARAVAAHMLAAVVAAHTLVVVAAGLPPRQAREARADWSRPYREPARRRRPYLGAVCMRAAYTRVVACTWAPHSLAQR